MIQSGPVSPRRASAKASVLVDGSVSWANKAKARRGRRGIKLHQNRERAAALAAPTSGPG